MPRIVIELQDVVADTIQKKLSAIGTIALNSQVALDALANSLKSLNTEGIKEYRKLLGTLTTAQIALVNQSNRIVESNNEMIASIAKVNRAQNNLLKSEEQLAQAYSNTAIKQTKANTEDAKFQQQIEKGNLELLRRKSILDATSKVQSIKQTTAQINLATQAEKNAIAINRQNVALQTASEKLKQAELRTNALGESSKRTAHSMFSLTNIFRALALIRVADQAIQLVDSYTLMQNRLKLVSTSTENLAFLQKELFKIAEDTRVPVNELTQSFVRYDYALKGLGATQKESLRFTKTLSETLAISGLTTAEQSSSLLQLSQALNKGKLDGDEFRTVMETLPTLATAIAKTMGVARGELIALAPQGKITSDIIRKAMSSIAEDTDKAFKNLTPTIGQAFTVFRNNFIKFIGESTTVQLAISALSNGVLILAKNIDILSYSLGAFLTLKALGNLPKIAGYFTAIIAPLTKIVGIIAIPEVAAAVGLVALTTATIKYRDELYITGTAQNTLNDVFKATLPQLNENKKAIEDLSAAQEGYHFKLRNTTDVLKEISGAATQAAADSYYKLALAIATVTGQSDKFKENLRIEKENREALAHTNALFSEGEELLAKIKEDEIRLTKLQSETLKGYNDDMDKHIQKIKDIAILRKKGLITPTQELSILGNDKVQKEIDRIVELANKRKDYFASKIEMEKQEIKEQDKVYDIALLKFSEFAEQDIANQQFYLDVISALHKRKSEQSFLITNRQEIELKKELNKEYDEFIKKEEIANSALQKKIISQEEFNRALSETAILQRINGLRQELAGNKAASELREQINAIREKEKADIAAIDSVENRANIFYSAQEAQRLKDSVRKNAAGEIGTLKGDLIRSSRVGTGGTIGSVRLEEIRLEEQRYKDAQAQMAVLEKDALNKKGLKYAEINKINAEFRSQEIIDEKEHQQKLFQINSEAAAKTLDVYAGMFGALSGLSAVFAKGRGKDAERAFKVTKALAYAEAVATTASAIAKANDHPFPYNIPLIVAAAATGATQIATIKNTELQGYAKGKIDIGGTGTSTSDSMLAYIGRGESVINSRSTARHKNILEAINADNGTSTSNINNTYLNNNGGGGNAPTINIINNTGGKIGENTKYNPETNTLDLQLDYIDAKMAQRYADGNGKLAKAIDGKRVRGY